MPPVAAPEKITSELIRAIRLPRGATYVALHANHPRELTPESRAACARMIDAGIPMLSQTVLLKGVNDDIDTLEELMRAFVETRIKPYYLHHADLLPARRISASASIAEQGLVRQLRARASGLCQPEYVLDIPGGHAKARVAPADFEAAGDRLDLPRSCRRTARLSAERRRKRSEPLPHRPVRYCCWGGGRPDRAEVLRRPVAESAHFLLLFLPAEQLLAFVRMIGAPLRAVARRHAWLRTGVLALGSGRRAILTLRRRAIALPLRRTIGLPLRALTALRRRTILALRRSAIFAPEAVPARLPVADPVRAGRRTILRARRGP